AGRLLLAHADTILAEVERAEDAMRLHANGANGEVRVVAFATAITLLVAPALTRLRETSPGLTLVVRDAEGHQGITHPLDGDVVLLACEQAGFQPRIVHQSDDFRAVAALVAAGAGVSLVPRLAVPEPTLALIRPLPDPAPTRRVYAAVRNSRADHPLITATLA